MEARSLARPKFLSCLNVEDKKKGGRRAEGGRLKKEEEGKGGRRAGGGKLKKEGPRREEEEQKDNE